MTLKGRPVGIHKGLSQEEVEALAVVYPPVRPARALLLRSGYPMSRIPVAETAEDFWEAISEQLSDGNWLGGRCRLLITASRRNSVNRVLGGWESLLDLVSREGPLKQEDLGRLVFRSASELAETVRSRPVPVLSGPGGLFLRRGEDGVLDFGCYVEAEGREATSDELRFTAPEIRAGHHDVCLSNVFCWGATMVFAATGESPSPGSLLGPEPAVFRQQSLREVIRLTLGSDPKSRPTARAILAAIVAASEIDLSSLD